MQVTFFLPLTNNTIRAPCPDLQTKIYFSFQAAKKDEQDNLKYRCAGRYKHLPKKMQLWSQSGDRENFIWRSAARPRLWHIAWSSRAVFSKRCNKIRGSWERLLSCLGNQPWVSRRARDSFPLRSDLGRIASACAIMTPTAEDWAIVVSGWNTVSHFLTSYFNLSVSWLSKVLLRAWAEHPREAAGLVVRSRLGVRQFGINSTSIQRRLWWRNMKQDTGQNNSRQEYSCSLYIVIS